MSSTVSFRDLMLFLEAWLLLALARLILIFMPFKKIVPLLGKTEQQNPATDLKKDCNSSVRKISVAVLRASRYSPWRTKCFEQALAAKIMIKRRRLTSTIFFG